MDITKHKTIYHICASTSWQVQGRSRYYVHSSLATEGFIHTCTKEQEAGVLERYFASTEGLLRLHIDVSKLDAELVYELAPSVHEEFPHIYGPISKSAIVHVESV